METAWCIERTQTRRDTSVDPHLSVIGNESISLCISDAAGAACDASALLERRWMPESLHKLELFGGRRILHTAVGESPPQRILC